MSNTGSRRHEQAELRLSRGWERMGGIALRCSTTEAVDRVFFPPVHLESTAGQAICVEVKTTIQKRNRVALTVEEMALAEQAEGRFVHAVFVVRRNGRAWAKAHGRDPYETHIFIRGGDQEYWEQQLTEAWQRGEEDSLSPAGIEQRAGGA
jgi:hypothetical protein